MAQPITIPYPGVPCVHGIPGGAFPGRVILVQGSTSPNSQRFAINLQCGPNTDPRDDIALHLNFRFVEMLVVRNHLVGQVWGNEETAGGMPLQLGQPFDVRLILEPQFINVVINNVQFCQFQHRMQMERISFVAIDGDCNLNMIAFEASQAMASAPPAYGMPPYGAPPPAYGAPGYGQPPGGYQPNYGQPGYGQPPGYQPPNYGQPGYY
ncbi:galectin-7-like [Hyposmocoma kahamanoa]|uniref:galectin-7-like n=1 Tax=Hyposmocoma kahamanoa TaxID=1477025 RepID=UPI000E6D74F9|nr:galectin-7-like [Hyposmocoma kahamanoa]XP_026315980.1 galectin-7-like [Hyposmocoma kahamanoa]